MDLNKKDMKNIMLLIVFAVLFYICVQKINSVAAGVMFVWHLVFPFILGGAIAFILNVPMHALENRLFGKLKERGKAKKIARPASLALSILFVIIVIWIVLVVLIPEIGSTFTSLSRQIEVAIPKMEQWLTETFQNNDLIEEQINAVFSSLEFNWDRIIETGIDFLRNGAGNVLGTTFSVAMTLINSVMNFVIAFVFACYILLQKEKLSVQIRKVLYAFFPGKVVRQILKIASLSYKTFSNFVTGQCLEAVILGTMFFVGHDDPEIPLCPAGRGGDRLYGPDPYIWSIYRLCCGNLSDPGGKSHAGGSFCDPFPGTPADRRKPDLSSCGGKFGGTAFYLGFDGSNCRRQSYGCGRNAGVYPADFHTLRLVPPDCS